MAAITTHALEKRFGNRIAIPPLNLSIAPSRFVGLLGVNGAGKTTLLKMLAGVMRPTAGEVRIDDRPLHCRRKSAIAFMSDVDHLYPSWTIYQAAQVQAAFLPTDRDQLRSISDFLGVSTTTPFGEHSRGGRARFRLALTLSRHAELFLLDEPFGGIDPTARVQVLQAVAQTIGAAQRTVVLATHAVQEVEPMFDDVVILHAGEARVCEAAEAIREEHGESISAHFQRCVRQWSTPLMADAR